MEQKSIKYGFRIVHIDNIPHIEDVGFVLPYSPHASTAYKPIGDTTLINARNAAPVHGVTLSEYIPFYFGPRSPMLYVIQHGNNIVKKQKPEDIVYCVIRIADIIRNNIECIFTNGHARSRITKFYKQSDLVRLNQYVSYNDVYATRWNDEDDIDLKRRKSAELLIKEELAKDYICGYVVYNENAKAKMIGFDIDEKKIIVNPNFYY
ncbi:MAG: DUF4433 domain-containing protein [Bacteroidales bacterium]|nr:DUF4433 domain-containing protein [Bacteroidales bacterium]